MGDPERVGSGSSAAAAFIPGHNVRVGSTGDVPKGTVTFLLTDVERSTALWGERADDMAVAVPRHYSILDEVVAANGGIRPMEQWEGDSIIAVFASANPRWPPAVDIDAPGEYRIAVELPPGVDTRELAFTDPSDTTNIHIGRIDFEERFVDDDGRSTVVIDVVIDVVAATTPYPGIRLWIQ